MGLKRTAQEACRLAENYQQARKKELWTPVAKSSARRCREAVICMVSWNIWLRAAVMV